MSRFPLRNAPLFLSPHDGYCDSYCRLRFCAASALAEMPHATSAEEPRPDAPATENQPQCKPLESDGVTERAVGPTPRAVMLQNVNGQYVAADRGEAAPSMPSHRLSASARLSLCSISRATGIRPAIRFGFARNSAPTWSRKAAEVVRSKPTGQWPVPEKPLRFERPDGRLHCYRLHYLVVAFSGRHRRWLDNSALPSNPISTRPTPSCLSVSSWSAIPDSLRPLSRSVYGITHHRYESRFRSCHHLHH